MKNIKFSLYILILLLPCCKYNNRDKEIIDFIKHWNGKEIVFPNSAFYTQNLMDSLSYEIPEALFKILIYIKASDCIPCKLQLSEWMKFSKELNELTGYNIPLLLFFENNNFKELKYILNNEKIEYPIYIDTNHELNKKNNLPQEFSKQTFLLDQYNKVKIIGNPIINMGIKKIYFETILNSKNDSLNNINTITHTIAN